MIQLRVLAVVAGAAICLPGTASSYANSTPASRALAAAEHSATVDAPAGRMKGTIEGNLRVFKGIPYARPPVGRLRWRPPLPLPRWQGVRETTEFGPACFQPSNTFGSVYIERPMPMSEDCLTLNIWAPADAHDAPVFFWIYGGALWVGASRDPLYDGARLAEHGVVVVSINYRLGVLGWLAHPQLSAESPQGISGNYGLLDQIAALEWVQHNIATFGGDRANVTIAGESAGALSVMYLMVSPEARGLFAKAIAESAYMISMPSLKQNKYGMPSGEENGARLAAALHASGIAALRAMDPLKLTNAAAAAAFGPWGTVDGDVFPEQMVTAFDKGDQAHVPILAGFNSGEIRSLTVLAPPVPASAAQYQKAIRDRYGRLADDFLRLYPATHMGESILATTRDGLYGWTAVRLVRKQTALGLPSYLYLFDHGYAAADEAHLHGFHASELPYVFGTFDGTPPLWPKVSASARETALSEAMLEYWTGFALTGIPRARNAPDWPAYESTGAYMHFSDTPHPQTNLMPGMYQLDEQVVCRRVAAGNVPWNWNVGLASPKLPPAVAQCR
ncbi:MAG TPA: carboxylesterase family protein [Steroidobacteraceae bacterium]|nr:carboxylesterase family protein [Steroidobacteraceae bacterium]